MAAMAGKRVKRMDTINIRRFGLAVGATFALLYALCMLIIMSAGRESAIAFMNSLLHGIDITSIIVTSMPIEEMLIGIIEMFIIGWLAGAMIASIYNYGREGKQ